MDRPSVAPLTAQLQALRGLARRLQTRMSRDIDAQVVWHIWGDATGRQALVLLHGGSGSWTHWVRNIEPLVAAGWTVFVPDIPGFGDSDLPPGGADVDAVIDPLAYGARELLASHGHDPACATWAGFSFGGMAAGLLAARHPDLCRRLVIVGAPAMGLAPQRQFTLKGWRHLPSVEAQMAVHRHNLQVLMLHDPLLIDDAVLALHVENVHRDRMPRRRLSATDILAQALREVSCPLHAIYGEHDVLYGPYTPQLGPALAQAARDFRGLQFVADAGHWVMFERAEAFNRCLLDVLRG